MKSYTDLEQSKVLLSIGLDSRTADMYYEYVLPKSTKLRHVPTIGEPTNALSWYNKGFTLNGRKEPWELKDFCIPCWSLAALLSVLHDYSLHSNTDGTGLVVWKNKKPHSTGVYDNPVDACVEMIIKLHELNLL